MEVIYMIIATVAFIALVAIIATVCVRKKKYSLLWINSFLVVMYLILMIGLISQNVINHKHLNDTSVSLFDRFELAFTGMGDGTAFKPLDPCENNGMDGPLKAQGTNTVSHFNYPDFVFVLPQNNRYEVRPLKEFPVKSYAFSFPVAAHGIYDIIIKDKLSLPPDESWMIQFVDDTKIFEEPAFNFIIGHGTLSLSCPTYFKIQLRVAVSASGKVYLYEQDSPKFEGIIENTQIENLNPDNDFGLDLLNYIDEDA